MKGRVRTDRGVVSLMVTIIMMLVISMIVLGFAQISRRVERQSLDQQLSTQAFLAAESGVNDARTAIQAYLQHPAAGANALEKTQCGNSGGVDPYSSLNYTIDSLNNVSYTCLLVTTKLSDIHQTVTYDGPSSTIPLHPQGGSLKTLHINWTVADQTITPNVSRCDNSPQPLKPVWSWTCDYGMLRMDMVPTDALDRQTLMTQQRAVFLYPVNRGGAAPAIDYGSMRGRVAPMYCTNNGCKVDIKNIGGANTYALRLSSIYNDGIVDITADGPSGPLQLADAQAQIDSTGKAQDVLRRIQVRMSLVMINQNPNYGLETGNSICKHFAVMPNSGQFQQDPMLVNDPTNPMCQPAFGP